MVSEHPATSEEKIKELVQVHEYWTKMLPFKDKAAEVFLYRTLSICPSWKEVIEFEFESIRDTLWDLFDSVFKSLFKEERTEGDDEYQKALQRKEAHFNHFARVYNLSKPY